MVAEGHGPVQAYVADLLGRAESSKDRESLDGICSDLRTLSQSDRLPKKSASRLFHKLANGFL
jgi:hypothetical protein